MTEAYTKRGTVRRITVAGGERSEVAISEAGRAVTSSGHFQSAPMEGAALEIPEDDRLDQIVSKALQLAGGELSVRRLTAFVSHTEHAIEEPARSWSESHARLFVRYENQKAAAGIDLLVGGASCDALPFLCVEEAAEALRRFDGNQVRTSSVSLAPHLTAQIWTWLVGTPGRHLGISQGQHPDYPLDGSGLPVTPTDPFTMEWPNTFRPSYRYPARRMALHLLARGAPVARRSNWRAVAFLENRPEEGSQGTGGFSFLVTDGARSGVVHPPAEWIRRMVLLGSEKIWFPYGAGSYGEEAELDLS
jgi:hypothetical protein